MIVAVSQNNVIGDNEYNSLPWNLPEDLSRFYQLTKNNIVVMGNKTYKSLPNGKLKNRINIVLTRESFNVEDNEGDLFFVDMASIWELINRYVDKKVFIIGGTSIYSTFFTFCSTIHYTLVDLESDGNVFFPFSREYMKNKSSDVIESEWKISISGVQYKYITYCIKS